MVDANQSLRPLIAVREKVYDSEDDRSTGSFILIERYDKLTKSVGNPAVYHHPASTGPQVFRADPSCTGFSTKRSITRCEISDSSVGMEASRCYGMKLLSVSVHLQTRFGLILSSCPVRLHGNAGCGSDFLPV